MKKRARGHHIVPKMYLRQWADDDEIIGVLDGRVERIYPVSINRAAKENDYYTIETVDGVLSDEWENAMSQIEGAARTALSLVIGGTWPLPKEHRDALANFVLLQFGRGRALRDNTHKFMSEIGAYVLGMYANNREATRALLARMWERQPTDEELDEHMAALAVPADVSVRLHNNDFIRMFGSLSEYVQLIGDMQWTLLKSSAAEFVTSDEPVVLLPHEDDPMPPGLLTAKYVTFPLSPWLCLRMELVLQEDPEDDNGVVVVRGDFGREATLAEVDEINTRTMQQAHSQVFMRRVNAEFIAANLSARAADEASARSSD